KTPPILDAQFLHNSILTIPLSSKGRHCSAPRSRRHLETGRSGAGFGAGAIGVEKVLPWAYYCRVIGPAWGRSFFCNTGMIKRANSMAANHKNINQDFDRWVLPSSAWGRKRGER